MNNNLQTYSNISQLLTEKDSQVITPQQFALFQFILYKLMLKISIDVKKNLLYNRCWIATVSI